MFYMVIYGHHALRTVCGRASIPTVHVERQLIYEKSMACMDQEMMTIGNQSMKIGIFNFNSIYKPIKV